MKDQVKILWDEEARVWTAESDDIPGLVLERPSFDALIRDVQTAAGERMELNHIHPEGAIQFVPSPFVWTPYEGTVQEEA